MIPPLSVNYSELQYQKMLIYCWDPDVVAGPSLETDVNIMGWERHNERVNAAKSALILMEIMPYWLAGNYGQRSFYNYTFGGKAMQMLFIDVIYLEYYLN